MEDCYIISPSGAINGVEQITETCQQQHHQQQLKVTNIKINAMYIIIVLCKSKLAVTQNKIP